jgi:hypothetical protein
MTGHQQGKSHPLHQHILFTSNVAMALLWLGFINTKVTLMHSTHLQTSNTLHEYMMAIARNLIRGFPPTHSVDVINRTSFSHKAPGIGELRNLLS